MLLVLYVLNKYGIKYVSHIRKDKCERRLFQNTDSRGSEWQLPTN
jgi:hypothetical protein